MTPHDAIVLLNLFSPSRINERALEANVVSAESDPGVNRDMRANASQNLSSGFEWF
jgi:hypothetical protein